jgi:ribosomal protection tetracycline resistance protein
MYPKSRSPAVKVFAAGDFCALLGLVWRIDMNIINIGILAHVDAGKTTLTESLLYASGTISEPGSVEKGTTRTDTMFLERQRGITIQTAVTSFQWHSCKVNIVDTPGHMDFLAEVYRSLAVLDGAILVLSAKDGVQAQTRVLFHALRKLNIPTIIFINKIDQVGIDLEGVYQSVRDKLSADIIIKQTVSLSSKITLTENTNAEVWDSVIENNDELLAKYIAGESISQKELAQEEQRRVQDASLLPVYHGSAKNGLGIQQLMDAVIGLFQPTKEQGSAALCGRVFKVEYTDCGQRLVYLRLYSGTLRLRDTVALAGREKLKITGMRIPSKGEIVRTDTAHKGEIVILPSDSLRLNDILGDKTQLPREMWSDVPFPMLRTTITPKTAEQRDRLLDALTQIADTDPLLHYEVDSTTHEIILSFLGRMQLEVVSALLTEKYKIETAVKEPTVIYLERPLKVASHTIHIEVPPNPFWASIGLSVTPLPLGSGVKYKSRVSLGYLNQSFQNAVMDGIRYGLEQGLCGWNVTDCKICFEYGLYYSPVSTPADFRSLAPIVLEQALKKSGTQLLEPYLSFTLYAPQEYLSRAYHDAPKYCATIETAQIKKDEVVFTGEIPARCIQAYRTDLAFYTNGRSVCLTELKGYQATVGEPVIQPRRPNSRLDKVRHMFQKVM